MDQVFVFLQDPDSQSDEFWGSTLGMGLVLGKNVRMGFVW